jgi:uncharacterized protein YukE
MDPSDWQNLANDVASTIRKLELRCEGLAGAGADKERRQIKQKIPTVRQELDSLDVAVDQWRRAPRKAGLTDRDLQVRATTVSDLRAQLRRVETAVGAAANAGGNALDPVRTRAALFQDYAPPSARPVEDSAETEYLSNQELLHDTRRRTEEEDEALGRIEQGLGTLKSIGLQQKKQLIKQEGLLDEMRGTMDDTDARLQGNIKRVDRIDEGSRGGCCALIIIALLIGLIVSLIASNWVCHILPSTTRGC